MSCRAELFFVAMLLAGAALAAPSAEEGAQSVTPPQSVSPAGEAPPTSAPAVNQPPPAAQETAPSPPQPTPQSPQETAPSTTAAQPPASSDFRAKAHEYKSAADGFHKPTGEITVYCDKTEWQRGLTHCTGNVKLTSDTMELRGETLDVDLEEGRVKRAHLTGEPARMVDSGGEGQQPISAQAKRLDYDPGSNIVELSGAAQLMRNGDRLTGELIRYDVAARRVQAAGSNAGQVKIVIQPPATPKSAPQP